MSPPTKQLAMDNPDYLASKIEASDDLYTDLIYSFAALGSDTKRQACLKIVIAAAHLDCDSVHELSEHVERLFTRQP